MQISPVFVLSYFYRRLEQDVFSRVGRGVSGVSSDTGTRSKQRCDHFGPSTEEEMEADLKRIDAMEEDQEVTSRFRSGFTMGELQSSAIPNSVIPSNVRFLSYENMKKSVTCSPATMQHPWVKGAFAVTGKLRKEIMDLKHQVNKLEEENRILRGIITKNITSPSPKREKYSHGYGHSPWQLPSLGECPGIVSPSHFYLYRFS